MRVRIYTVLAATFLKHMNCVSCAKGLRLLEFGLTPHGALDPTLVDVGRCCTNWAILQLLLSGHVACFRGQHEDHVLIVAIHHVRLRGQAPEHAHPEATTPYLSWIDFHAHWLFHALVVHTSWV